MKSVRIASIAVISFMVATLTLTLFAEDLKIGDAAPEVSADVVSKDGKNFKVADQKGKVVVVEFWATWCPPCKKSIPHLTELKKKFGDKVEIIGISGEDKATVEKFYNDNKDTMKYIVAADKNGASAAAYMKPFNVNGIPHAFIIQDGKLVWHGHPMQMEKELEKAVAAVEESNKTKKEEKPAPKNNAGAKPETK